MNPEIYISKRLKHFLVQALASGETYPEFAQFNEAKASRLAYIWYLIAGQPRGIGIDGELNLAILTQDWWTRHITNYSKAVVDERKFLHRQGFIRMIKHERKKGFADEYGVLADDVSDLASWVLHGNLASKIGKHHATYYDRQHEQETDIDFYIRKNVYDDICKLDIDGIDLSSNDHNLIPLRQMKEKTFAISRGKKGNRLYSPITSLNKKYRKHLRYKGKYLAGIDISAAQLFFLSKLSGDTLLEEHCINGDFYDDYLSSYLDHQYDRDLLKITIISWLFDRQHEYIPSKILRFKLPKENGNSLSDILPTVEPDEAWVKGEIKKYINERIHDTSGMLNIDLSKFRKKKRTQVIHSYLRNQYRKIFRNKYPVAYKYLTKITANHKADKSKPTLAALLQQFESNLMLDTLYNKLSKEVGISPLFPLHDGIYTTEDNLDLVYQNSLKILINLDYKCRVSRDTWR